MKQQIRTLKRKAQRVELTPFPVWKKWYYILTSSVGTMFLTMAMVLAVALLLMKLGVV